MAATIGTKKDFLLMGHPIKVESTFLILINKS
jgi:hypothetical protein